MYLIPCGEGTRSCSGCNPGLGELYITLVAVLRKLKKLLFATDLVRSPAESGYKESEGYSRGKRR